VVGRHGRLVAGGPGNLIGIDEPKGGTTWGALGAIADNLRGKPTSIIDAYNRDMRGELKDVRDRLYAADQERGAFPVQLVAGALSPLNELTAAALGVKRAADVAPVAVKAAGGKAEQLARAAFDAMKAAKESAKLGTAQGMLGGYLGSESSNVGGQLKDTAIGGALGGLAAPVLAGAGAVSGGAREGAEWLAQQAPKVINDLQSGAFGKRMNELARESWLRHVFGQNTITTPALQKLGMNTPEEIRDFLAYLKQTGSLKSGMTSEDTLKAFKGHLEEGPAKLLRESYDLVEGRPVLWGDMADAAEKAALAGEARTERGLDALMGREPQTLLEQMRRPLQEDFGRKAEFSTARKLLGQVRQQVDKSRDMDPLAKSLFEEMYYGARSNLNEQVANQASAALSQSRNEALQKAAEAMGEQTGAAWSKLDTPEASRKAYEEAAQKIAQEFADKSARYSEDAIRAANSELGRGIPVEKLMETTAARDATRKSIGKIDAINLGMNALTNPLAAAPSAWSAWHGPRVNSVNAGMYEWLAGKSQQPEFVQGVAKKLQPLMSAYEKAQKNPRLANAPGALYDFGTRALPSWVGGASADDLEQPAPQQPNMSKADLDEKKRQSSDLFADEG
jgi:hypothetical protein